MATKKVSYMNLLKESIAEFDVTNAVDVKGPMVDPILGYDGGGELPTNKDAASVLERYYFTQDADEGVSVQEHEDNVMDEEPGAKDGTSKDSDAVSQKKDIEKAVTEADEEEAAPEEAEEAEAASEAVVKEEDEKDDDEEKEGEEEKEEEKEEEMSEAEQIENAVIEKLIGEMEQEVSENREKGDRGVGGEEAMGTGDAEKVIPDRKDATNEADVPEEGDEEKAEEVDVDKEVAEGAGADAGVGPGPMKAGKGKMGLDDEEVEEAFKIFKEEVEAEEETDIDPDKIQA